MGLFSIFKRKTPGEEITENIEDQNTQDNKEELNENPSSDLMEQEKGQEQRQSQNQLQSQVEEILSKTVREIISYMLDTADVNGARIGYRIPETDNTTVLYWEPLRGKNVDKWTFTVGVCRNGSDKMFKNYIKDGDREDVAEYLRSETALKTIVQSIIQLSHRVDMED